MRPWTALVIPNVSPEVFLEKSDNRWMRPWFAGSASVLYHSRSQPLCFSKCSALTCCDTLGGLTKFMAEIRHVRHRSALVQYEIKIRQSRQNKTLSSDYCLFVNAIWNQV